MKIRNNTFLHLQLLLVAIVIALSCARINNSNQVPEGLGIPTGISIMAGNQKASISWHPVSGATSYAVYYASGTTVTTAGSCHTCIDTSYTVSGLTNRTKYAFAVTAANALGESGLSASGTATPFDPNQPALVLTPGDSQMTLSWQSDTSASSFTIYWDTGNTVTKSAPNKHQGVSSPFAVIGLINMRTYSFGITAVRNGTESEFIASASSQPVPAIPASPGVICIIAQDKAVKVYFDTVSWAISYRVYYSTSDLVTAKSPFIDADSSPAIISSLNNGTVYSVIVAALDGLGMSSFPQPSKVEPQPASSSRMGMKSIPAGTFQMGSNDTLLDGALAFPAHTVTISFAFMMDSTEVTQDDYLRVMGLDPAYFYGNLQRPVENVTWFDAVIYCNARSKAEGRDTIYSYTSSSGIPGNGCYSLPDIANDFSKNGYRLPTEAEWEYACRAGSTAGYYWGDTMNGIFCWYTGTPNKSATSAVAFRVPNSFGLYDMSGNVAEWCNDRYLKYSNGPQIDPFGPASGSVRVVRGGGALMATPLALRSACRSYGFPFSRNFGIGFRCVRQP